jgi:hypothetical protein
MKIRVRQVIAVALVATALASDATLAAAQARQQPDRSPESKNLVTRLTQQLRRSVVGAKVQLLVRQDQFAPVIQVERVAIEDTLGCASSRLSDLQLHLPPPVI